MRVRKYLLKKVEYMLSSKFDSPVWIIKKGRFYYLQDVVTGKIDAARYDNLAEIVEIFDLSV